VKPLEAKLRKRQDKGRHWWELRSYSYYGAFEGAKVFWPDITKFPRFSRNDVETYVDDKGFLLALRHQFVLGVLQSRATWLCVSQLCVPFGERAGLNRYQQKTQFISRLPMPEASEAEREAVGSLAMEITENARARYELHERTRRRILSDLPRVPVTQDAARALVLGYADTGQDRRPRRPCDVARS
jgi:hypothetical protein